MGVAEAMTGNQSTLFASAASYYKYRPDYPESILNLLKGTHLCAPDLLIDCGCADGRAAIRLSDSYRKIIAVDADAEMVEVARQNIAATKTGNIVLQHRRAEELDGECAGASVFLFGASLHWMDAEHMMRFARTNLCKGGSVVLLGAGTIWRGKETWKALVKDSIYRWLGPARRAGQGVYVKRKQSQSDVLRAAGLEVILEETVRQSKTWTVDELLGALYSSSFCSPAVLGASLSHFEDDVRERLSGVTDLSETIDFRIWAGR